MHMLSPGILGDGVTPQRNPMKSRVLGDKSVTQGLGDTHRKDVNTA